MAIASLFKGIGQDFDIASLDLSDSIRILLLLSLLLDGEQIPGLNTPKGFEVTMNLVIFIWQLDVVLFDILPPMPTKST